MRWIPYILAKKRGFRLGSAKSGGVCSCFLVTPKLGEGGWKNR